MNPVNMHMTVKAYLYPSAVGGWNSPIKSMEIKSMELLALKTVLDCISLFVCYTVDILDIALHTGTLVALCLSSSNFFATICRF